MKTIYRHSPHIAAEVEKLAPLQRGCRAARSMARQRAFLRKARHALASSIAQARYYLALWAEERNIWAHLVGKVSA